MLASVSSIPVDAAAEVAVSTDPRRGGEIEPSMSSEIRDPVLRAAFEAAYEAWARKYPHLLEDWPA